MTIIVLLSLVVSFFVLIIIVELFCKNGEEFFFKTNHILRQPGVEPGSTASKATMLTATSLTLMKNCLE